MGQKRLTKEKEQDKKPVSVVPCDPNTGKLNQSPSAAFFQRHWIN